MRSVITLLLLLLFGLGFDYYIYVLFHSAELGYDKQSRSILYYTIIFSYSLLIFLDRCILTGATEYHYQFSALCELILIVNFGLILLNHIGILTNIESIFAWFNSTNVFLFLFILWRSLKHGLFKK